ncbi:MAG: MFS transporter [Bradymonadaceae bacterium]|nr:MFS transporter [Lujinxingiaceae bacterium]
MSEPTPGPAHKRSILESLGLHRPELRAWAMYDWAITGMWAVIVATVFPIYFAKVAGADLAPGLATRYFGIATTLGLAFIALLAPIMGAFADFRAVKKKMIGTFAGIGIAAVACMFFIHQGDWLLAAILFVLANIGANGSMVFYDAMLPHIAREDEIDRVSTAGFAIGYAGAGILLAINLTVIMKPDWFGLPDTTLPTRLAFLSVALWWFCFAIPLFRRVPEPPVAVLPASQAGRNPIGVAFERLGQTFKELRGYKQASLMLLAFLVYNDGIGTIIRMAAIYGEEKGIESHVLIGSIVMVQFVGIPCTFLFGALAGRIGAKPAIFIGLVVYAGISVLGYFMQTWVHFVILAALVGLVQGGTQALSRSLFASMVPREKSGEFFGFFAVFEKFAGIFGPLIFTAMIIVTGASQYAILSIIAFFIVGGAILIFVDVDEGRRVAREANRAADERARTPEMSVP